MDTNDTDANIRIIKNNECNKFILNFIINIKYEIIKIGNCIINDVSNLDLRITSLPTGKLLVILIVLPSNDMLDAVISVIDTIKRIKI